jgi:cytochrome c553
MRELLVASLMLGSVFAQADEPSVGRLSPVQTTYLARCGGCHGIQGVSEPSVVPTLRHNLTQFLCTREGRQYLIRLPSIASSPLSDQALTELMNFVVFGLGATADRVVTAPAYRASEVHELRARPLNDLSLGQYRARVVEDLIKRCGASPSLRSYAAPAMPPTG